MAEASIDHVRATRALGNRWRNTGADRARWLDPTIDPNGRRPGWCYLGDPRAVNTSPAGFGRCSSLRSWLSQWSFDLSNTKGPKNAARIRCTPVLQVENLADDVSFAVVRILVGVAIGSEWATGASIVSELWPDLKPGVLGAVDCTSSPRQSRRRG